MLGGEAGTGTRADVSVRAGAESTGALSILAAGAAGCGAATSAVGTGAGVAAARPGKLGCGAAAPAAAAAAAPLDGAGLAGRFAPASEFSSARSSSSGASRAAFTRDR